MKLNKEEIDFIKDCCAYYLANEEQFVSYDEYMKMRSKIQEIMNKLNSY